MRPVESSRTIVLGEFGGLGMPIKDHTWQDERNWGYVTYDTKEKLTDGYVNLLAAMRPLIGDGLSAAVYTQTSDVEGEVNGLMTYDRELVKMDVDRIAAAARRLYGPLPTLAEVLPTSEKEAQTWRYALEPPAGDWFAVACDDSTWKVGLGGFGASDSHGARVGTPWHGKDVWLRRIFKLDAVPPGALFVRIFHDEDAEVYINGQLAMEVGGFNTGYQLIPCKSSTVQLLLAGENTIAVHCRQTMGGQYIDLGLATIVEPSEIPTTVSAGAAAEK